jgi:pimeloyl-ACP methyl ester carboxylesterase
MPQRSGGARHYAELVAPLLNEVGPEPIVLVGHSFGGRVACVLAARFPERVRSLVLTGVPLLRREGPVSSPAGYRLIRFLRARGVLGETALERARQKYGSLDYRRATGVMREVLVASVNESYGDELAALRCPVHLVWGEGDREVPVGVAERSAALITSSCELTVCRGAGHLLPLERAAQLGDVVMKAVSQ